ncbi:V4R domain-containing protein [Thermodesulfobacteriota bacterium]
MPSEKNRGYRFQWKDLGDIEEGRPNLGASMNVSVYRLLQYTLREVITAELGSDKARQLFVDAGKLAGSEFCRNLLNTDLRFSEFLSHVQSKLKDLNIGILRVEKADEEKLELVLTVMEDLDCSGLPVLGETVCDYDEGLLAGILGTYTGREFVVKEVDCWASGSRVCRFEARPKER